MYKYEYVRIENTVLAKSNFSKYKEIIDEYAKKGYRFVGFVPITINFRGRVTKMELVFEIQT